MLRKKVLERKESLEGEKYGNEKKTVVVLFRWMIM